MVTGTLSLLVGFLAGVILFYCISKHQFKTSSFKPDPSSHQLEEQAVSSSNLLQQTSPEYEEVVEMRKNTSYGELKKLEKRAIINKHKPQSSEPESCNKSSKDGKTDLGANAAYQCWLAVISWSWQFIYCHMKLVWKILSCIADRICPDNPLSVSRSLSLFNWVSFFVTNSIQSCTLC